MDVLTNLNAVIISQYTHISNHHIDILNLYNIICQLYLKAKKTKIILISIKSWLKVIFSEHTEDIVTLYSGFHCHC